MAEMEDRAGDASLREGADSAPAQSTGEPPPPLPLPLAPSPELPPLPPLLVPPPRRPLKQRVESVVQWVLDFAHDYFLARDVNFWSALAPMMMLSLVLYTRWPGTNYIFDEQEALLANPYVNATQGLKFIDAIHRDFWGLPADRSVGSYRPIPNFLWRSLWHVSKQPFFHHIYNVLFHSLNAAILTMIVWLWTKRRGTAYLAGFTFLTCAVLTEAVSGIVGIADVLGGMGALLALLALSLPAWSMPAAVFLAVAFGLFCKESALVCVPLVPLAAVIAAPLTHPNRPARFFRGVLALAGAGAAFVVYVELRRRWFLSPLPSDLASDLPDDTGIIKLIARDFMVWFHQAPLPKDPLNNPLAEADTWHRISGALRVYERGFFQVIFPRVLSGDYSYPQEPVPDAVINRGSILGGLLMVLPPLAAVVMWVTALVRERRARQASDAPMDDSSRREPAMKPLFLVGLALFIGAEIHAGLELFYLRPHGHLFTIHGLPALALAPPIWVLGLGLLTEHLPGSRRPDGDGDPVPLGRAGLCLAAIGLVWIVVSFFPHSNIPVVLPTVRAERFWYFPAIGSSMAIAVFFSLLHQSELLRKNLVTLFVCVFFFLFQSAQAYRHAMNYRNDLDFWQATANAVPNSAKAHLNFSVMKGARGDLDTRLAESKVAMKLAPKWAMAHVYTGDTLCRMHRSEEAWPYYKDGFEIGPNELSLIALALQCLYDEGDLKQHDAELRELAEKHEGSWIAYLGVDTLNNAEKNKGVDPKYRPRGYNEGPKE